MYCYMYGNIRVYHKVLPVYRDDLICTAICTVVSYRMHVRSDMYLYVYLSYTRYGLVC